MDSNRVVLVEFPSTSTNDEITVPGTGEFYDVVQRVDCYSNSTQIPSWTGSTDSRLEFYQSGSLMSTYPGGSLVNGGASIDSMKMKFDGQLSVRWFHNQNAFSLPSVKTCTLVLEPSNWFSEFTAGEGYNSMTYTAMTVVFVAFGAWVGKRIAQGRRARKNNHG